MGALSLAVLLLLLMVGIPVAFAMGAASLLILAMERGISAVPAATMAQRVLSGLDNFPLLAIPLFLLAGNLMNTGGITERIFGVANALVGHIRGGLGHVNVLASMIFAGMSGSATADAAGLGSVEIKAMTDAGYDRDYSVAITGASALIGPIIPPSIPMVLYGILAEVSVGALFIGGIVPGLLMAGALMTTASVYARRRGYPKRPRARLREVAAALRRGALSLLTPVIIIGGITFGVFTATEAAAVACLYAAILVWFVYREVNGSGLWRILRTTMRDSAVIMLIFGTASLFGYLLVRLRVPFAMADWVMGLTGNPVLVLLILNLLFLLIGCFESAAVTITIMTPILMPLVERAGIDPIHFGVVMVLNLMIGNLTPPFGMVLFVLQKVGDLPFDRLVRALMPFLVPLGAVLLLTILVPQTITWLPRALTR